ncbi:hypothetical protein A3Q56_05607, partial [Intoshia linei]
KLEYNKLTLIPKVFIYSDLKKLINLNLAGNTITHVNQDDFKKLITLKELNLSSNRLVGIDNDALPKSLQTILMANNLYTFHDENAFQFLNKLETLNVDSNQITTIPDLAFRGCLKLKIIFMDSPLSNTIDFSFNNLQYININTFAHVKSTQTVKFNNNKLQKIYPNMLNGIIVKNDIDLSFNYIQDVTQEAFKNIQCSNINLNDNQIYTIGKRAFYNIKVDTIILKNNPLNSIYESAFENSILKLLNLKNLKIDKIKQFAFKNSKIEKQLDLSYNKIQKIENNVFDNIVVKNLFLDNNNLKSIQTPIFNDMSKITNKLTFNNNELNYLCNLCFGELKVKSIYLNKNYLWRIPKVSMYNVHVENLYLNENHISKIIQSTFNPLIHSNILNLYLENNRISFIDEFSFKELKNLNSLDLSHNQITFLHQNAFNGLNSLKSLNFEYNAIEYLPNINFIKNLNSLQLNNNKIISFYPNGLPSKIKKFDLKNNKIQCDCALYQTFQNYKDVNLKCQEYSKKIVSTTEPKLFNLYASQFLCNGLDLSIEKVEIGTIILKWKNDDLIFPNSPSNSPLYTFSRKYTATCLAKNQIILEKIIHDNYSKNFIYVEFNINVIPAVQYTCRLKLDLDKYSSVSSFPVFIITPNLKYVDETKSNDKDYLLPLYIHDFSKSYYQFSGNGDNSNEYNLVQNVDTVDYKQNVFHSYVRSKHLIQDYWFRKEENLNFELNNQILNLKFNTLNYNRYYSENFFIIDGIGYKHENQMAFDGKFRNFGFTVKLYGYFLYNNLGTFEIGGGDELLFFIHGKKLAYLNKNQFDECINVNISTSENLRTIKLRIVEIKLCLDSVKVKYGSISSGKCVVDENTLKIINLGLTSNCYYKFEIFVINRYKWNKSVFLLETRNIILNEKILNINGDGGLINCSTLDENVGKNYGVTDSISVIDQYKPSRNDIYKISFLSGNEENVFDIKQDDNTLHELIKKSKKNIPTNFVFIKDANKDVIICESGIYTGGIPIDKTSFEILSISFPINNVRVIIKNNLDYEAHKYIHLYIQCTVNNKIGIFLVQIKIQDSNDNCPTMLIQYNENVVSKSRRSLDLSYIAKITIDDKDEGINKKTKFHLHAINTVPNINTQYNPDTNYDSLIRDKTNVIVTILGVDEGTPPLATKLDVEYSMGNTCLLSHNFQEIPLKVDIDQNFGYINILSPGYYLQNEKIKQIGMEHGWILDKQIKASSNKERNEATRSRLNEAYDPILLSGSGWVPFKSDPGEWIKLSLKNVYNFHALLIQGNGNNPYWVTKFKIAYRNTKSIDNEFVFYYFTSNNIITNILNGNIDQSTVVKIDFKPIIITDTILIYPIEWEKEISIRFDYIGISMEELNYYRETCIRCETTYYCHGDGSINECARCSSDITCTKDSYEHSFGSYGQCTSCLNGYFCQKGRAKICPLNFHTNCNSLLGCTKPCKKCGSDIICNNGEIINCSFTKTDSDSKCTLCIDSAEKKCPCLDFPCYDGSCQIYNSYNKKCVECPIGMHAINQICVDIDECKIPNICWNNRCINRNSGFQCLACPYGYRGTYRDGVDIQQSRIFMHGNTIKLEQLGLNQECNDINECKEDVNACPSYTICQNEPGGFNCLKCKEGYIFNECKECVPKNFCISNKICHSQSTCVYGGPGIFMCNCNVGFAGDGFYCGKDSDLDEIPDDNLICFLDKVCFKDNAIHVPNSGQEDTDNDGIGDVDDDDIDNDGILNNYDNCIFISNFLQKNKDKDYFGNVCDKCASKASVINTDFDSDNIGDVCDKDADNDAHSKYIHLNFAGINNTQDNCVYHSNKDQLDQDGDGVGDVCDNCPEIKNSKQTDHNFNFIGDSCDDLSNLFKLD